MLHQADKFYTERFARIFILWSVLALFACLPKLDAQSVSLSWSPSTDPNVAGYAIYYGTVSHNYTNTIIAGNVTSLTVSGLKAGVTYYFAATTYDAAGDQSDFSNEAVYNITNSVTAPPTGNHPPTLNPIADISFNEYSGFHAVTLSGITSGSATENQPLTVTVVCSNPALIPLHVVNYISPNTTGSLLLKAATNATGTATITVTVNDGGASNNLVSQSFNVTVVPAAAPNQPPTLNPIAGMSVNENASIQIISLSGITSGSASENQTLTVSAASSNPALIPAPTINYASPNATGSLLLQPANSATGTATITVTVNDGGSSNNLVSQSFTVTVVNPNAPVISNQLTNMAVLAGQNAVFSIAATGQGALSYQWQFNGTNLSGATNPTLILKQVSHANAGTYSVLVSNSYGTVSSTADLTVMSTPAANLASAAPANGHFSFTVTGVTGYAYAVEASTDMKNWTSLQTNVAPFVFVDTDSSNHSQRFYRTEYIPAP